MGAFTAAITAVIIVVTPITYTPQAQAPAPVVSAVTIEGAAGIGA